MAGYHQHYLQNSFEQPRVLKACEMSNTADDFNVSASYVQFQMSHHITLTQDTNAKGFSFCCESSYGKTSYKCLFDYLSKHITLSILILTRTIYL